ncbi:MAG: oxidoreductase, partial [Chloroflexota bacterium]
MKVAIAGLLKAFPLVAALIAASGCAGGQGPDRLRELEAVQVREYQGEQLSSIRDLRDNSIKGPQEIDKASYRL